MELGMIFKAILSLAFVLGLLMLTLWFIKYCEVKGCRNNFMKKLSQNQRVNIVETRRIDARNSLVLVQRDDVEHLVLLGATQNMLIETTHVNDNKKVKK